MLKKTSRPPPGAAGRSGSFEHTSFCEHLGFGHYNFIGLANYTEMFQTPVFWKATWNTILLRILTVPVGLFPRGELCPIFPPCEGADLCHIFPIPSCHPAEDPV